MKSVIKGFVLRFCAPFAMLWLIGCATAPAISSVPELTYSQQAYVIGIADQLRIDVWRNADLTRDVRVRPDGFITMPLMGDVQAQGQTPEALAAIISQELKAVIKNPEVAVTVSNPVSVTYQFRVRALGQVNQPISIAFTAGMTVVDLVLAAGGVSPFGAAQRTILYRLTRAGYVEHPVHLNAILLRGEIATNYLLQPADILIIPEKSVWKGEF
ncbi:MAG: polysaccharide biosynthesis/export family protein [Reinekea forsetii]|uniref:polysaccharide biosynthesis/export family protein n=1 Tax=Reinekea forsetii TaxID=1336806 RepID=UPI00235563A1|nr:polysaccharide biosynthesis/export family protein [Reinekea forsetii]MDO7673735.1 polysaccharide biosynthesis/export family protein [Reinekea forsetii]